MQSAHALQKLDNKPHICLGKGCAGDSHVRQPSDVCSVCATEQSGRNGCIALVRLARLALCVFTQVLHRCKMFLRLSDDELQYISDYVQTATMSRVCLRFWGLLHGRHVSCNVTGHTIPETMAKIKGTDVYSAVIRCTEMNDDSVQALAELKETDVRSLTLSLPTSKVGDMGAQALAALRAAPRLTTLTLDLCGHELEYSSTQALAALRHASTLESLTINLNSKLPRYCGAHILAAFSEAPSLEALRLSLDGNQIGDSGALALASLKDASNLKQLDLGLQSNQLGDSGARALATLGDAPSLTALNLDLRFNQIGNSGATALSALRETRLNNFALRI